MILKAFCYFITCIAISIFPTRWMLPDARVWLGLSTDDRDRDLDLVTGTECHGLIRDYDEKHVPNSVERGVWSHMSKLKTLDLSKNQLPTMYHTNTFSGLSSLETLDLSHNKLAFIGPGVLCNLTQLKQLVLNNNDLERIDEHMFSGLSSLQELDLDYNSSYFKGIDAGALAHLSQLKKLVIGCYTQQGKQPMSLHAGMFRGLVSLQHLRLHNMAIERVEKDSLSHLSNLQCLRLHGNRLSRVDKELLSGLDNLELLDFDENRIELIEDGSFTHMSKLKELNLRMNPHKRLDAQVLGGLVNLETLTFTFSSCIQHLDPGSLDHMLKLNKLYIQNYCRSNNAVLASFKRHALSVNPQLKITTF